MCIRDRSKDGKYHCWQNGQELPIDYVDPPHPDSVGTVTAPQEQEQEQSRVRPEDEVSLSDDNSEVDEDTADRRVIPTGPGQSSEDARESMRQQEDDDQPRLRLTPASDEDILGNVHNLLLMVEAECKSFLRDQARGIMYVRDLAAKINWGKPPYAGLGPLSEFLLARPSKFKVVYTRDGDVVKLVDHWDHTQSSNRTGAVLTSRRMLTTKQRLSLIHI